MSPADGRIAKIERQKKGTVPSTTKDGKRIGFEEIEEAGLTRDDYYLLAIVLSPFDVHVNRAPISGRIVSVRRTLGKIVTTRQPVFEFINERVTTVFENEMLRLAVIQIAAPIAASIKSFVRNGDTAQIGQRYGAILLGSQVDVIIPSGQRIKMTATLGSKVRAGETIIAEIQYESDESWRMDYELPEAGEGRLDVQAKGLARLLGFFYLGNLWIASVLFRLAKIGGEPARFTDKQRSSHDQKML